MQHVKRLTRMAFCLVALLAFSTIFETKAAAHSVNVTAGVGETSVVIQGTTSPHAHVTILENGSVIGTVTADANGHFSKTFPNQTPGIHTYQVYAQDSAGRLTDTVSKKVSVQSHAQTTVDFFLPPTIEIPSPDVTQGDSLTVRGETAPHATVIVFVNGKSYKVTANAAGQWQLSIPTSSLSVGSHTLYAIATKSGGEQSAASQTRSFRVLSHDQGGGTVDGNGGGTSSQPSASGTGAGTGFGAPSQPAPSTPTITWPKNGDTVQTATITVRGKAEPRALIELWNRGQLIGTTFADADGNWSITVTLHEYANMLQARACYGNSCSGFSQRVLVHYQSAGSDFYITLTDYRFTASTHETIAFEALLHGGEAPYSLDIDWGDGASDEYTARHNSEDYSAEANLQHTYETAGNYRGFVTATSADGKKAQASFTAQVFDEQEASTFPWPVLWLLLLFIILLIVFLLWRTIKSPRGGATVNQA